MTKAKFSNLQFRGFVSPRYTQVPDELFDELMAHLSGAELKVLLYIIRRTFGFKKDSDNISLKQICTGITTREGEVLDKGTGLSLSTVQIALKGLIGKNCVLTARNRSKEKGDEATTYSLNILPYTDYRQGGIPKIGNGGYRKSVTQQTDIQQTDLQHRNSNSKSYISGSKYIKTNAGFQPMESLLESRTLRKGSGPVKIPDAIKSAIDDISREFGDKRNFRSNLTQVLGIINSSRKSPEAFASYLFEARSITKQQKNVEKKMPYFFSVLKDISGVKNT
jgi:Bacteriophage replication protein O